MWGFPTGGLSPVPAPLLLTGECKKVRRLKIIPQLGKPLQHLINLLNGCPRERERKDYLEHPFDWKKKNNADEVACLCQLLIQTKINEKLKFSLIHRHQEKFRAPLNLGNMSFIDSKKCKSHNFSKYHLPKTVHAYCVLFQNRVGGRNKRIKSRKIWIMMQSYQPLFQNLNLVQVSPKFSIKLFFKSSTRLCKELKKLSNKPLCMTNYTEVKILCVQASMFGLPNSNCLLSIWNQISQTCLVDFPQSSWGCIQLNPNLCISFYLYFCILVILMNFISAASIHFMYHDPPLLNFSSGMKHLVSALHYILPCISTKLTHKLCSACGNIKLRCLYCLVSISQHSTLSSQSCKTLQPFTFITSQFLIQHHGSRNSMLILNRPNQLKLDKKPNKVSYYQPNVLEGDLAGRSAQGDFEEKCLKMYNSGSRRVTNRAMAIGKDKV
ncbi:hypothetical protein VP01_2750g2 [Puccinia sorghi]|uniref:Uncharacterized protein n=1 Tax=Puccinia sorghi TaxID=27349 RepID=A0A0L6V3P4_9BASI|nr:hypothetical protein VP01_2750g2 [Puccinia sorghi]